MSETKYESKVYSTKNSAHTVYTVLSNLENLNRVKDLIPKDKVQELEIHQDHIRIKVDGLGQKVTIKIVDTIPDDTIKFGFENIPLQLNFWVQMKQLSEDDTRMKLTIKADIPMMFRVMFEKKLQQGLDQAVDMLCQVPYDQWG
mgnify:CR=1 FL=1